MPSTLSLSKELIQINANTTLLAYKRDGGLINAAPIDEYIRFTIANVNAGQTAVIDLDKKQLDIIPITLLATFKNEEGTITFTVKRRDESLISCAFTGCARGESLPNLPIDSNYTRLLINTTKDCKFIFLSCKQIASVTNLSQDYFE